MEDYDAECEFEWLMQEQFLAQRSEELRQEMDNRKVNKPLTVINAFGTEYYITESLNLALEDTTI